MLASELINIKLLVLLDAGKTDEFCDDLLLDAEVLLTELLELGKTIDKLELETFDDELV